MAKSTHAGLPRLRFLRRNLDDRVHFRPFDGWEIPSGRSVIAEVYPTLWSRGFPRANRTSDQHDAWSAAEWLRTADLNGRLEDYFRPNLSQAERDTAQIGGWILGVR